MTRTFELYNSYERRQPGLVSSTSCWVRELSGCVSVCWLCGSLKVGGGVCGASEVSLMRIGRKIMDVAFGVSALMAGGSSTPEAGDGLAQHSSVVG